MPSLDELKKIAARRTQVKWDAELIGPVLISPTAIRLDLDFKGHYANDNDFRFIATAANTYDQLLAIAVAAKREHHMVGMPCPSCDDEAGQEHCICDLKEQCSKDVDDAIAALEDSP